MLTLKFYAGADDAPPRLPVRVLPGVTDVRLSAEKPPRLVYSLPSPGLVSRGRDDVSYLPLSDLGPVEVFNAAGVSLAVLNAGPEVLTVPRLNLTADERRRMQGGGRIIDEPRPGTWPIALTPPGVIDTVGGYPALALALQSEGYSFGSLTKGFGWWFGKWSEAAERGECGAADTLRQAILGAEEHYRDAAERTPGDVGAAMRTRAGTILDRARRDDGLEQHKPLRARRIPLDTRPGEPESWGVLEPEGASAPQLARRIFPPVPAEDWLPVEKYPANWLDRGERLAVMVEDDAGNVGRAWRGADGTWWQDLPADATPEQLDFQPVRFSYLPAPHRFACRTCFRPVGGLHLPHCPQVSIIERGPVEVLMGDTPPAEPAPVEPRRRNAAWFEGAMTWAENLIVQLPDTHDGRNSWLLNHGTGQQAKDIQDRRAATDPAFAAQIRERRGYDEPEPAPTVPFFVNGEQYDTTAGVRSGKALYARVGNLDGQMLVDPAGKFVGDTDLVDIQGGELFATTPYRDPILRPEHTGAFAAEREQVTVTLDGANRIIAAGAYTATALRQVLQVENAYDLLRPATQAERNAGARGHCLVASTDTITVTGGEAFQTDIPF